MNIVDINNRIAKKTPLLYEEILISSDTVLYIVEINNLKMIPDFDRYISLANKIKSNYKNEKSLLQSLAGKCLLLHGLEKRMNKRISEDDIMMEKLEHGKPYLVNHRDIEFNISHSGDFAICSISMHSTGVDIENTDRKNTDILPLKKTFTCKEREKYNLEDFFRIWVMKESYLKMKGTGLSYDMTKLETDEINDVNFYLFNFDKYIVSVSEPIICE